MRENSLTTIVAILLLNSGLAGCGTSNQEVMSRTKRVTSQGGQVELNLPENWTTKEDSNAMMFFPITVDSGVLRLSVLTFDNPKRPYSDEDGRRAAGDGGGVVTRLPSGTWCGMYQEAGVEDGVQIQTRFWHLATGKGSLLFIALFSWTIETEYSSEKRNIEDLALVDEAIRSARFLE